MRYSRVADSMPQSGIRELMDLAWTAGDVIHLEVGEPSFPTPEHVVEAAGQAARDGWTRYVASAGIPALREAIAAKVGAHNRVEAAAEQVIVTAGGIQAIWLALLAVLEPGDEVLLLPDSWIEVEIRGDDYLLVREREIHAVASERADARTGLYL